ncbi:MAG: ATP synthase F0 subunit B [Chloroflexi bacterium]|nr:ATP synthase F0 subunit B [Chloroflexota bacterium]
MDIQHLVDRLEDLIDEGRHVPFSKYTLIDEERALEIIDQMRISIPEEIEKAARVLAQRDRILAQANEEAARLVQLARERGDQMVDRESTVQAAQSRAANIIEAAHQEASNITNDADGYVLETLSDLEQQLIKILTVVRNGINQVHVAPAPEPTEAEKQPKPPSQAQFAPPPRESVEVAARRADNQQQ